MTALRSEAIRLVEQLPEEQISSVVRYINILKAKPLNDSGTSDEKILSGMKALMELEQMIRPVGDLDYDAELASVRDDKMEKRQSALKGLMSFAGTLPEDFDYERELEEAREEKYARFV